MINVLKVFRVAQIDMHASEIVINYHLSRFNLPDEWII